MLDYVDQARLERAFQEAKQTDVDSVVIAIMKDNDQVVFYNMGETDGRRALYNALVGTYAYSMSEINARIMMNKGGAE